MKEGKTVGEMIREAMRDRYQGEYKRALEKYGIIWNDLMDKKKPEQKLVLEKAGEVLHQIGVTYQNMGEFLPALLQLKQAKCFRRDNGDIVGLAYTAFQIPMCRLARGDSIEDVLPDFEIAKRAIEKAFPELQKRRDYKKIGDMYQNLAFISQQKGQIEEAIDLYLTASKIQTEEENQRGMGLTCARLAECYIKQGIDAKERGYIIKAREIFDTARQNANWALDIFKLIPDKNRIEQVNKTLDEIAAARE